MTEGLLERVDLQLGLTGSLRFLDNAPRAVRELRGLQPQVCLLSPRRQALIWQSSACRVIVLCCAFWLAHTGECEGSMAASLRYSLMFPV